jgi:hypothetical protein
MVRLGGLWVHKTKEGETFLSGTFGSGARLLVMKNGLKDSDSQPDYIMYVEESQKKTTETIEEL